MDVVFSCLGMVAESKRPDHNMSTLKRAGSVFFFALTIVTMLLGIVATIPRTGATSFEIGVQPLFPNFPPIVYGIFYFVIVFACALKPGKLIDIVGKYLTPVLIVGIIIIIFKGLVTPLGPILGAQRDGLFAYGVIQGYQTFDTCAPPSLAMIYVVSIKAAGFTAPKEQSQIIFRGSIIGSICLIVVYLGLYILGAQLASEFGPNDITSTALVSLIVERLFGRAGLVLFAIVVILACLTTAIGSVSATARYFMMYTKDKIKFSWYCIAICLIGAPMTTIGVNGILNLAMPFLMVIMPVYICFIILSLFTNWIKNDNVFIFAGLTTALFAAFNLFEVPVVGFLPFHHLSFNWLIPAVVAAIIGNFVPTKTYRDPVHYEAYQDMLAAEGAEE